MVGILPSQCTMGTVVCFPLPENVSQQAQKALEGFKQKEPRRTTFMWSDCGFQDHKKFKNNLRCTRAHLQCGQDHFEDFLVAQVVQTLPALLNFLGNVFRQWKTNNSAHSALWRQYPNHLSHQDVKCYIMCTLSTKLKKCTLNNSGKWSVRWCTV